MRERNQTLRKNAFKRDNFTCQKCKIQDKTSKILEAHHIIPLYMEENDNLNNIITLCSDCHRFTPDKKEDFDSYMKEECDGTMTTLINAWNKFRKENPELIEQINKEEKRL
jgi:predicted HNH restriction endonuclease